MDIERSLIALLIENDSLSEALEHNLPDDLFEGEGKKVWRWMKEYYTKYSSTPGTQALSQKWPDFKLVSATEVLQFYIDKLRSRFEYNALAQAVEKTSALLRKDGDPSKGVDIFRRTIRIVDDITQVSTDMDWSNSMEDRLEAYRKRKKIDGIDGYSTPFPTIDKLTQGFHPGELIFISAKTGTGKTWIVCLFTHWHWTQGVMPILFEKEMTNEQIGRRIDAIHNKLPYSLLREGKLTEKMEKRWEESAYLLQGTAPFPVIDSAKGGISHIGAKCDRYKPDICYIDGGWLLEDDDRTYAGWESRGNITKNLKVFAKERKIPVVITFQLHDEGHLQLYKGMENDADFHIKMSQNEDQRIAKVMAFDFPKHREGEKADTLEVNWDLDNMEFNELGTRVISQQPVSVYEELPLNF